MFATLLSLLMTIIPTTLALPAQDDAGLNSTTSALNPRDYIAYPVEADLCMNNPSDPNSKLDSLSILLTHIDFTSAHYVLL